MATCKLIQNLLLTLCSWLTKVECYICFYFFGGLSYYLENVQVKVTPE